MASGVECEEGAFGGVAGGLLEWGTEEAREYSLVCSCGELEAPEVENYATLVLGTLEALSDFIEEKQELPGFDLQYSVGKSYTLLSPD